MDETNLTMDDFKTELEHSLKRLTEGDLVKGTVIGISDTEVTVDLSYSSEGIIKLEELSNDPRFSIKADVTIGEEITAMILSEDKEGNLLLSKKKADDILSWDKLKTMMTERTVTTVKVSNAVNGGVVTYLEGIRAFIPASMLSLSYVEDVSTFVGKVLKVIVITADKEANKLVLSAKEVLREEEAKEKSHKISQVQKGIVTTGIVDKLMPFGAFVSIGEGLSGLVHISQICGKRIKSPAEVLKEGQEVKVKVLDVKDGKISLSIKAVSDAEEVHEDAVDIPAEYSTGEQVTTGLGDLLKNFKF
ncbi:S1 RNA-binding domain-containing protein [Lachnoclostridium phytofermentans]|uniref:RNA binding S1 domain protein n=1 Tax=Lachnoclostridium phytofermentans (strain ATCC 700394 / DSM 18823 / ISDg) TaxID=357809 RepID=A9KQA3_LACP7|nr:S1 RNA-binding domain-containing protein [Lachnoclostridium phytofermentans]ABX40412.1 RNA binding S1 domain protein [Lachnoclostridium phytofermentans ISDg]